MPFSFMETSFVISLGITFVLLLLLIYHFKQRLTQVENQQDSMFEIFNNLAQELNNIKMTISLLNRPSTPYPHNDVVNNENIQLREEFQEIIEHKEDSDESDSDDESDYESDSDDEEDNRIIVSDDDEEDNISVEEIRPTENADNEDGEVTVDILDEIQIVTPDLTDNIDKESEPEKILEKPDFSKMNLGALKSYIVQQGWVDDASKMKKAQILSLIDEHQ